jgi:predicted nucleic acid-binding Zn ribbon protein
MRPLQQAVPGALAEILRSGPMSAGKVSFAWTAAVGPALERVTAVRLEERTLVVETASTAWAREVRRSSPIILGRIQALLGAEVVDSIKVRRPRDTPDLNPPLARDA